MSEFVRKALRIAAPPLAFLHCLAVSSLLFMNYWRAEKFSRDFGVYWRAANQPLSEIYFWQGAFPFPYAPTMLLWIEPLSVIPRWPAYFAFTAISLVALAWACRPYLSKWAIALVLIAPPTARGLYTGQVCAILSAAIIWAFGTSNRVAAGIALGSAASIKPQLVLMAPLMLALNRDWRAFIAAGSVFGATILLSLIFYGPERWPEWLASMAHFHGAVADTTIIQIATTPAAVAERLGYNPLPFMLAGTVIGAGIIYLFRDAEPLEKASAVIIGSLMASPYALAYDLTGLMPLLVLSIFKGRMLPVIGIGTPLHPVPFVISTFELLRGKASLTFRSLGNVSTSRLQRSRNTDCPGN